MKILTDLHGCDKNLVDAEEMLPRLLLAGHTLTDDPEEANIISAANDQLVSSSGDTIIGIF